MTIITTSELLSYVEKYHTSGKKIVFTNGCFDLFHAGHLYTLEEAKQHGDILIVGINSDMSTRQVKGDGRPVIPEHDRASIVAGLACVDHVFIFDDIRVDSLINIIRPDYYIKSQTSIPIEAEINACKEQNCKVRFLHSTFNSSTTDIIRKIEMGYSND